MYPTRKLLTWAVGIEFFIGLISAIKQDLSFQMISTNVGLCLSLCWWGFDFQFSSHFFIYLLSKSPLVSFLNTDMIIASLADIQMHAYCIYGIYGKGSIIQAQKLCMLKLINSSLADLCYLQLHSSSYGIRSLKFLLIHLTNCFDTRKTEIKVCMEWCKAYSMFDQ